MEYLLMVLICGALTGYLYRIEVFRQKTIGLKWLSIAVMWLLCGMTYWLCISKFGVGVMAMVYFVVTALIILLGIIDLLSLVVPADLLHTGVAIGILTLFFNPNVVWYMNVAAFVVCIGLMWGLTRISGGAIGDGDIYVIAIIALVLGWEQAFASFLIALVMTGTVGIILLIAKVVSRKTVMPFIPFLAAAQIGLLLL